MINSHIPILQIKNSSPQYLTSANGVLGCWGAPSYNGWDIVVGGGGSQFSMATTSGQIFPFTTNKVIKSQWTYIAVKRDGNNFYFYINNTEALIHTQSLDLRCSNSLPLYIGRSGESWPFFGNIGQVRITRAARTITNIPQTAFPENIDDDPLWNDVVLLTKPVGGVLTDLKGNTINLVGSPTLDYVNQRFGLPTSIINGNTNYYTVPSNANLKEFGTSNFTIEAWIYCI